MVLVGTGVALPDPFTEFVIYRNSFKDFSTSEFLDIFHNKFLTFFYLSRKKRFSGLSWESPDKSIVAKASNLLGSLGRERKNQNKKEEVNWVRHTGLLCGIPRSMEGLLSLLKDRFSFEQIDGDQFVGCWYKLEAENIFKLGNSKKAPVLGKNAVLGNKFWDQTAGIRLSIKNLSWASLQNFLPGGRDFLPMKKIIQRYLSRDIRVEILLTPQKDQIKNLKLSLASDNRLGLSSWIRPNETQNFQEVKLQFDVSNVN
jgi:type VI secretion system protein ImpH